MRNSPITDPRFLKALRNLEQAVSFQRQGLSSEAEKIYARLIKKNPDYFDALHLYGLFKYQQGQLNDALRLVGKATKINPRSANAFSSQGVVLAHLERHAEALASFDAAIKLEPNHVLALSNRCNSLNKLKRYHDAISSSDRVLAIDRNYSDVYIPRGAALLSCRRYMEALASYEQSIKLNPAGAMAWNGCGNVLYELKRYDDALAAYDKALSLKPDLASAWRGRGETLAALKRTQESIVAYRQALKNGGNAELIQYDLAALGAESPPLASPEHYIVEVFDSYADDFDRSLIDDLKYQTPTVLADTIKRFVSSNTLDILDLGCGTGLMGKGLRPLARTLTGVDLSTNMLGKARQREIYDQLVCSELTKFLQTQNGTFDLAVATDVFIYIGDLSAVFQGVRRALRDGGLFCFSVEAADEGDFVLRSSRRYAHSLGYLQMLAKQNRFAVDMIEPQIIRRESRANINGYHAIMRCC